MKKFMLPQNIVIVGITGVGKTTIGRALAEKLGNEFIDLDKAIEAHCGVDIPTIFAIEGEEGFRNRESAELTRVLTQQSNYVLSVGGGCLNRIENQEILISSNSIIIQLVADLDIIVERLAKSPNKRPLLANTDLRTKIEQLYQARKPNYDRVTHFTVSTSISKPHQVVEQIINFVRNNSTNK
jgi:shikimate kinase